ncbi:hypothetical protein ACWEQ4_01410 [Rhodococcus sp. NPDC003994]
MKTIEVKFTETRTRTATIEVDDDFPDTWTGEERTDDKITDELRELLTMGAGRRSTIGDDLVVEGFEAAA